MGNPITDVIIGMGSKILDRVLPDQAARDEAKLKLLQLAQSGELAMLKADTDLALGQIEVNKVDAASGSFFTSGARPSVIWVCSLALANDMIFRPLGLFIMSIFHVSGAVWPQLGMDQLMPLLMGLLGLGAMRSYEKVQGVSQGGAVK